MIGSKHFTTLAQSNPTALLGLLNAHAKERGYARHATDVNISGTVDHRHVLEASERFRELDDATLARLLEAKLRELPETRHMIDITPRHEALDLPRGEAADDSDGQG